MIDRFNRIVLGAIGLVVAGAAAVGLLASRESLELDTPGELYRRVSDHIVDNSDPWAIGVVAVAAVLLALALLWAWRQVRPKTDGRLSTTTLATTGRGRTTLAPVAVARALAQDLGQVPGVTGSKVKLVTLGERPELVAFVSIRDDVEADAVRAAFEEPFQRVCQALAVNQVSVDLRLRPTEKVAPRVA